MVISICDVDFDYSFEYLGKPCSTLRQACYPCQHLVHNVCRPPAMAAAASTRPSLDLSSFRGQRSSRHRVTEDGGEAYPGAQVHHLWAAQA